MNKEMKQVCGVINKGGTVLLTLGKDKLWQCPTFSLAEGEKAVEALERRLKESLNIDARSIGRVHEHEIENKKKIFLHIKDFKGKIKPNDRTRWFDVHDLDGIQISIDSKFAIIKSEMKMGYGF